MARAEVFNAAGQLVSTIAQEGMIRTPSPGQQAHGQAGHGRWEIRMDDDAGPEGTTGTSH